MSTIDAVLLSLILIVSPPHLLPLDSHLTSCVLPPYPLPSRHLGAEHTILVQISEMAKLE